MRQTHLDSQVQVSAPLPHPIAGEGHCVCEGGWSSQAPQPIPVLGLMGPFGFEDLSLEAFHDQIVLEMVS